MCLFDSFGYSLGKADPVALGWARLGSRVDPPCLTVFWRSTGFWALSTALRRLLDQVAEDCICICFSLPSTSIAMVTEHGALLLS